MSGFNLPPGVSSFMIPGNDPETEAWERVFNLIYATAIRFGKELVSDAVDMALGAVETDIRFKEANEDRG